MQLVQSKLLPPNSVLSRVDCERDYRIVPVIHPNKVSVLSLCYFSKGTPCLFWLNAGSGRQWCIVIRREDDVISDSAQVWSLQREARRYSASDGPRVLGCAIPTGSKNPVMRGI